MITNSEFRHHAHQFVDWMADFLEQIEEYPVKSQVKPGEIFSQLPTSPPDKSQPIDQIMGDFREIIIPGMTHWQSPNFFAYFPANSSYPSILAEMLTATLGAQCMVWETSPAAAELEEMVMKWLKQMTGLPTEFHGVIQDTASSATLCAILSAREKYTAFRVNDSGLYDEEKLKIYCSTETHSSIEKAVKIAGLGKKNLIKIDVDDKFALKPHHLMNAIKEDIASGNKPICVIATIGTTGSTAIDSIEEIAAICKKYNIWLHIDAALAGTALILPEFRWMIRGIENADSFVFNPHKWMFTNFDCSAYFVKDPELLIKTFEILPEYLKTKTRGEVNDYRDWGIALGRRFRALKLWFVIRNFGVEGLQEKVRLHISLAKSLSEKIEMEPDFELLTPTLLNTVCFRYHPPEINSDDELNKINEELLHKLNKTGELYLSHTTLNGTYAIRMVTAQTNVKESNVINAWDKIKRLARS
jgi:aromatic-L-amino-acid decarboxylase